MTSEHERRLTSLQQRHDEISTQLQALQAERSREEVAKLAEAANESRLVFALQAKGTFVQKVMSGAWHELRPSPSSSSCISRRTRCGWLFTGATAIIYKELDAHTPYWRICERCMPERRTAVLLRDGNFDPTDSQEE